MDSIRILSTWLTSNPCSTSRPVGLTIYATPWWASPSKSPLSKTMQTRKYPNQVPGIPEMSGSATSCRGGLFSVPSTPRSRRCASSTYAAWLTDVMSHAGVQTGDPKRESCSCAGFRSLWVCYGSYLGGGTSAAAEAEDRQLSGQGFTTRAFGHR